MKPRRWILPALLLVLGLDLLVIIVTGTTSLAPAVSVSSAPRA